MAKARTPSVQGELAFRALDKNGQRRGGARVGAGRKPNQRRRTPHAKRPSLRREYPQHVTLRVTPEISWLRRLDMYAAIRRALRVVLRRSRVFRIVHISVQNTHVHLLVEASDKRALSNGLRAFEISAATHLNAGWSRRKRVARRRGQVFSDRYFAEILCSPTQARNALVYVLNNGREHGADRSLGQRSSRLDPFASGMRFHGWRERPPAPKPSVEWPDVSAPTTWFLTAGWKALRSISVFDIPGPSRRAKS